MSEANVSYYERRAREEERAARLATKPEVVSAHRQLAIEYAAHARELGSDYRIDPELTKARPILRIGGNARASVQ